ncbi:MAG: ABC transporter permease [Bacteroidetes bacterium]|nr:MAG: ABC transporter permease [Bacteroidota bacterium]
MFDYDKWQEIFISLRRHKVRTIATALAVWWGIFMLVILVGAGNGLRNSFEKDFGDDALNSIWIWPDKTTLPWKGLRPGRQIQFRNRDYELMKRIEGVEYVTGRIYLSSGYLTEWNGKALQINIRAVHPDHRFLEGTIMTNGRFINDLDIKEDRKVAVIGKLSREELMGNIDPVGQYLNIKGGQYKVVGEFIDEGNKEEMRRIYIPITTAQKAFATTDIIHNLMVTVGDATKAQTLAIADKIRAELAALHNFSPQDKQAIYIRANIEEYERFMVIFNGISFFIWFVGIGSIIAGVVGVSNIMLIVVKDRTKEIGIRKALGATPRSIVSMVLQEAIFLTGVAGYVGLICGFSIVYGLRTFMESNDIETEFFYNPEVDFGSVLAALIFLVLCGTLAGLIPAIQAARVNPIVAMRQ